MKKKFVLGLTSLVVASAVAIGGTLAFMTGQTGTMTNNFRAVGDGITGAISEDKWDGFVFGVDEMHNGTVARNDNDKTLGINMAKRMEPAMVIPKNPTLHNTSENNQAYMAIKVVYSLDASKALSEKSVVDPTVSPANSDTNKPLASLTINSTLWQKLADKTKYYKDKDGNPTEFVQEEYYIFASKDGDKALITLGAKGDTSALFNSITIDKDATYDNVKNYSGEGKNFNIKVMGAAVQTTGFGVDQTLNSANSNALVARDQLVTALDGIIY